MATQVISPLQFSMTCHSPGKFQRQQQDSIIEKASALLNVHLSYFSARNAVIEIKVQSLTFLFGDLLSLELRIAAIPGLLILQTLQSKRLMNSTT